MKQLFLFTLVASFSMQSVNAGKIYKCTQASGKIAYQDQPCKNTKLQKEIKQRIKSQRAKNQSTKKQRPQSTRPSDKKQLANKPYQSACHKLGQSIFDKTIKQDLQHPHAAAIQCQKRASKKMKADPMCLNDCIESWANEYQKEYMTR